MGVKFYPPHSLAAIWGLLKYLIEVVCFVLLSPILHQIFNCHGMTLKKAKHPDGDKKLQLSMSLHVGIQI